MILTCPACSARYRVKDELVPPSGKKVKCKKCGTVFRATRDEEMADTPQVTSAPATYPNEGKPKEPAPTATVMVDSKKIEAMVKAQQQAERGRKPAPPTAAPQKTAQPPQNIVVEQAPPIISSTQPPVASQPDQGQVPGRAPKRKSFTDVDFDADEDSGSMEVRFSDEDRDPEDRYRTMALATQPSSSQSQIPSTERPTHRPEPDFQLTDAGNHAQDEPDFSFDVPETAPAPDNSPLRSELDDFQFGDGDFGREPATPQSTDVDTADREIDFEDDAPVTPASTAAFQDEEIQFEVPDDSESDLSTPADGGFPEIEAGGPSDAPETQPAARASFYEARIEGTTYPKLSIDTLTRWIREGRLLESDTLSVQGANTFKRADEFDEINALFERYFKSTSRQPPPKKSKKKSLIARLFGRG